MGDMMMDDGWMDGWGLMVNCVVVNREKSQGKRQRDRERKSEDLIVF